MKTQIYHIRFTGLDRDNIRKIAAHIRRLNREIGITTPVSIADVIGWALHRCVLLIEQGRADE